jgi:hypothetical protein
LFSSVPYNFERKWQAFDVLRGPQAIVTTDNHQLSSNPISVSYLQVHFLIASTWSIPGPKRVQVSSVTFLRPIMPARQPAVKAIINRNVLPVVSAVQWGSY